MHKKIVEAIKFVIENSPVADKCDIFVKTRETGGFGGMCIITKDKYLISHFKTIALHIGQLYGEGLSIQEKGIVLIIS